jgi:hypothetical protein
LDRAFLRRFNKRQNLGRDVLDDVTHAERQGIVVGYGYLFDPRHQTVAQMEEQMRFIARTDAADAPENLSAFVDRLFRRPWEIVSRRAVLRKVLHRIVAARTLNPVYWYMLAASSLHCFVWALAYPSRRRSYLAGEDVLDPQYVEHLGEITEEDHGRYFKPVALTDADGQPMRWLQAYIAPGYLAPAGTADGEC